MAKSSSSLILVTVFAFTSTESNQRNRDAADLVNFPGHVLEGIVCVWMDTGTSEISKNTTLKNELIHSLSKRKECLLHKVCQKPLRLDF